MKIQKTEERYSADLAEQLYRYACTYESDETRAQLIKEHVRDAAGPPEPLTLGQLIGTSGGLKVRRTEAQQGRYLARHGCEEIAAVLCEEMEQLGERLDWADQFPLIYGASEAARMWDALTGGTPGLCGASEAAMVMAEAALSNSKSVLESHGLQAGQRTVSTPSARDLGQALEAYPEGLDEAGRKCFDRVRAGLGLTSEDAAPEDAETCPRLGCDGGQVSTSGDLFPSIFETTKDCDKCRGTGLASPGGAS